MAEGRVLISHPDSPFCQDQHNMRQTLRVRVGPFCMHKGGRWQGVGTTRTLLGVAQTLAQGCCLMHLNKNLCLQPADSDNAAVGINVVGGPGGKMAAQAMGPLPAPEAGPLPP